MISSRHLATYLNDHLAGSTTAIDMLSHLAGAERGTPIADFATALKDEVAADRRVLENLMVQLDIPQSTTRKASAWVAEKIAQLKLRVDDPGVGSLHLLESLEAVSLGVEGKLLLWRSLQSGAASIVALRALDFESLIQKAEKQRAQVEVFRVTAAKTLCQEWSESRNA